MGKRFGLGLGGFGVWWGFYCKCVWVKRNGKLLGRVIGNLVLEGFSLVWWYFFWKYWGFEVIDLWFLGFF